MDTAFLKIKFTPLIQEAQKSNSKRCLEIVPEVSCIQNLDKLIWREENNLIEYAIPITYKIIVKKTTQKSKENVKTYHSCVDLLQSSSVYNCSILSSEVSKILSDTFLRNKVPIITQRENFKKLIPSANKSLKLGNDITTQSYAKVAKLNFDKETEIAIDKEIFEQKIENLKVLCDKPTSTESIFDVYNETELIEGVSKTAKLSLSPICSVNTNETRSLLSNTTSFKIYEYQKDLTPLSSINNNTTIGTVQKRFKDNEIAVYSTRNTFRRDLVKQRLPQRRIAQYVSYMETELLSVKLSYEEIMNKCVVLGLQGILKNSVKNFQHNALLNKPLFDNNKIDRIETCPKLQSNRAVYSIVFND